MLPTEQVNEKVKQLLVLLRITIEQRGNIDHMMKALSVASEFNACDEAQWMLNFDLAKRKLAENNTEKK